MSDYQAMYTALFNKITDVIEELQAAQQQTEEMYTSGTNNIGTEDESKSQ